MAIIDEDDLLVEIGSGSERAFFPSPQTPGKRRRESPPSLVFNRFVADSIDRAAMMMGDGDDSEIESSKKTTTAVRWVSACAIPQRKKKYALIRQGEL